MTSPKLIDALARLERETDLQHDGRWDALARVMRTGDPNAI